MHSDTQVQSDTQGNHGECPYGRTINTFPVPPVARNTLQIPKILANSDSDKCNHNRRKPIFYIPT
jgi:hypothetical protein